MARAEIVGGTPSLHRTRLRRALTPRGFSWILPGDSIRQGEQVRLADVADVGLHTKPRVEDEEYDKASE
jgi:hypothetical protein